MATSITQIPDIQSGQSQKEVTANIAHDLLDRQLNQLLGIAVTGAFTLTSNQMRENAVLELTGTPGAPFTMDMFDTNQRLIRVINNTDDVATIRNSAAGGVGQPVVAIGDTVTFHYDGTDFHNLLGPEQVSHYQEAIPTVSEVFFSKMAIRRFSLNDEFAGSLGRAVEGPNGGAVDIDVQVEGSSIGTISFADNTGAAQVATFVTAGGAQEDVEIGERLELVAPANMQSMAKFTIDLLAFLT